jgi:hypothetical protein
MTNDPSKAFQKPTIRPFDVANRAAQLKPVETPRERLHLQPFPYNKDVSYLDVVAAVGNVPGTSNQFNIAKPTMVCVDGFYTAGGTLHDLGAIKLWFQGDGGGFDERQQFLNAGPYWYFPRAGRYFLRGAIAATPIGGAIIVPQAVFHCSIHEDIDPLLAQAILQSTKTRCSGSIVRAIGAAAVVVFQPPSVVAASMNPPAAQIDVNGMLNHCHRITFSNCGANPVSIAINDKTPSATEGFILPANSPPLTVNMGGISTVYCFSTLGTNVYAYYEFI